MTATIGTVDEVNLEIKQGSSLNFDVTYKDAAGTIVPINGVTSKVRDGYDGEVVLDIGANTNIVANVAQVRVSPALTLALGPLVLGRWDFEVTTVPGEQVPLMEGTVRVMQSTL